MLVMGALIRLAEECLKVPVGALFGDAVNPAESACASALPMEVLADIPGVSLGNHTDLMFEKKENSDLFLLGAIARTG